MKKISKFLIQVVGCIFTLIVVCSVILEPISRPAWIKDRSKVSLSVNAQRNTIELDYCLDGDTANFKEIGRVRFILIDTPEIFGDEIEYKGIEAAEFTCNLLKKANVIEYELEGQEKDKWGRTRAWIFVDDKLLQEEIAKAGYVKQFFNKQNGQRYYERVHNAINDKYSVWQGN